MIKAREKRYGSHRVVLYPSVNLYGNWSMNNMLKEAVHSMETISASVLTDKRRFVFGEN